MKLAGCKLLRPGGRLQSVRNIKEYMEIRRNARKYEELRRNIGKHAAIHRIPKKPHIPTSRPPRFQITNRNSESISRRRLRNEGNAWKYDENHRKAMKLAGCKLVRPGGRLQNVRNTMALILAVKTCTHVSLSSQVSIQNPLFAQLTSKSLARH